MTLPKAEKQRRYRQRREADPLRRAEHKAKCKAKYPQDLTVGKQKHIGNMTTREQRKHIFSVPQITQPKCEKGSPSLDKTERGNM